jgi:hypothetical protein
MKVVILSNLRWQAQCPSWYRLLHDGPPVDLLYNGDHWYLTSGELEVVVPDRDTGAMMLARQLNRQGAGSGA